ncbi:unnamed protein product [Anisakis simplex]|uniref:Fibrinogen C-terminal domain-containing protein n=1 Tax=Anisakis simplex TaxID=6269 RepID=A0A0M3JWF6_ANISI|nr:unnamed protein product [Anisakis simplex]
MRHRLITTAFVLPMVANFIVVQALNYRCDNNQVVIVQGFGNDSIRMHCQNLNLCGHTKLRCSYDSSQPLCGGKSNFVAQVSQSTPTAPLPSRTILSPRVLFFSIAHTCCDIQSWNGDSTVLRSHLGNDCFVYELPDVDNKLSSAEMGLNMNSNEHEDHSKTQDDEYTLLKLANQLPDNFENYSGYRLRLFLLKNKSPPLLIVKGIERRPDGYRVTICRPRCEHDEQEDESLKRLKSVNDQQRNSATNKLTSKSFSSTSKQSQTNDHDQSNLTSHISSQDITNDGLLKANRTFNVQEITHSKTGFTDESDRNASTTEAVPSSNQEFAAADNKSGNIQAGTKVIQLPSNGEWILATWSAWTTNRWSSWSHSEWSEYDGGATQNGETSMSDPNTRVRFKSTTSDVAKNDKNCCNNKNDEPETDDNSSNSGVIMKTLESLGRLLKQAISKERDQQQEESNANHLGNDGGEDRSNGTLKNDLISSIQQRASEQNGEQKEEIRQSDGTKHTERQLSNTITNQNKGADVTAEGKTIQIDNRNENTLKVIIEHENLKTVNVDKDDNRGDVRLSSNKGNIVKENGKNAKLTISTSPPPSNTSSVSERELISKHIILSSNNTSAKAESPSAATVPITATKNTNAKSSATNRLDKKSHQNERVHEDNIELVTDKPKSKSAASNTLDNDKNKKKETERTASNSHQQPQQTIPTTMNPTKTTLKGRKQAASDERQSPEDASMTKRTRITSSDMNNSPNNNDNNKQTSNETATDNVNVEKEDINVMNIINDTIPSEMIFSGGDNVENSTKITIKEAAEQLLAELTTGGGGVGATGAEVEARARQNKSEPTTAAGTVPPIRTEDLAVEAAARSAGTQPAPTGTKPALAGDESASAVAKLAADPAKSGTAGAAPSIEPVVRAAVARLQAADAAKGGAAAGMNCFSADTMVQTQNGLRRMKEVEVGDYILVPAAGNVLKYERVEMFYHREPETRAKFVELKTASGRSLTLTELHLLPLGECEQMRSKLLTVGSIDEWLRKSRFAYKARRGDCVLAVSQTGQLFADPITKIGRRLLKGIYSPITVEGSIVTDGVLASCFSQVESHFVQKLVYDFMMLFYRTFDYCHFLHFIQWSTSLTHPIQHLPSFIQFIHHISRYIVPFAKY